MAANDGIPVMKILRLSPRVPCAVDVRNKAKYQIAPGASHYDETVYIEDDPNKLTQFIEDVVGWSKKSFGPQDPGPQIERHLPARHPFYRWLWASGINSVDPVGFPTQANGPLGAYAKYTLLRINVAFSTPPFPLMEDGQVDLGEFQRYVSIEGQETTSSFIQQKNGCFRFGETAVGWESQTVPESGGMTITVSKTRIKLLWHQVPDIGLFTGGWPGAPTKILDALGRVNDAAFLGYPKYTILFDSYNPIPRTMPVDPTLLGLGPQDVPRSWDVQLVFDYFNPESGEAAPVGWQGAPNPKNRKWYHVYINGLAGGDVEANMPYDTHDMESVFHMN